MRIHHAQLQPYQFCLTSGSIRKGAILEITEADGNTSWGDIAPLPGRNQETLSQALNQFASTKIDLLKQEWRLVDCMESLYRYCLCPSLYFAWESALLSLLNPVPKTPVTSSALFMGPVEAILEQASLRESEGFQSAKLKVSHLTFTDAAYVIHQLKNRFRLRIDVNQAWSTKDALDFFSQFAPEEFEYVEDPFQNPRELDRFTHPLAVEESFIRILSLQELEKLPNLQAVVFKPTCHGGYAGYLSLLPWAHRHNIKLILSSNFESDIGLACIADLAIRLPPACEHAIGIGTYHHMQTHLCSSTWQFSHGKGILKKSNLQ